MRTCTEPLFGTERTDKIIIVVDVPVKFKELNVVYCVGEKFSFSFSQKELQNHNLNIKIVSPMSNDYCQ